MAADDRLAELLCWILVLTQLAVLVHEGTYRRDSEAVGWALMGLLVSAPATGAYLIYVDVKREREVLKDLMKHQKRTLGRRLSSLGSRLGLKVPEEDVDVEGPASPLAAGRAGSSPPVSRRFLCPGNLATRLAGSGVPIDKSSSPNVLVRSRPGGGGRSRIVEAGRPWCFARRGGEEGGDTFITTSV